MRSFENLLPPENPVSAMATEAIYIIYDMHYIYSCIFLSQYRYLVDCYCACKEIFQESTISKERNGSTLCRYYIYYIYIYIYIYIYTSLFLCTTSGQIDPPPPNIELKYTILCFFAKNGRKVLCAAHL